LALRETDKDYRRREMEQIRKTGIRFLAGFFLTVQIACLPFFSLTAYAMNARIAFSDPSVQAGSDVSVSMKITSESGEKLGSANLMLSYDSSLLEFVSGDHAEGGAGSIHVTGLDTTDQTEWQYTLKFKALQPGSAEIKVSTQEVYDTNEKLSKVDKLGSSKITISAQSSSSANAALTSLKISPGVLSPAFSSDVTDYTTVVGEDVGKITLSAATADSGAKVVISGGDALKMGENTILCKVTAQDGATVKTYTVKATKQKGETPKDEANSSNTSGIKATINGADYDIATSFDKSLLPDGFESDTYSYKGTEVQSAKRKDADVRLLYLIGQDGSGSFYFYDEKTDSWSAYVQIEVNKKSITIIPLESGVAVPAGLVESTLELNGTKVRGWTWAGDKEQRYFVVYGMNNDGEKNFYRYDMKEKTIQRYFEDPAADTGVTTADHQKLQAEYDALSKSNAKKKIYLIVLFAALAAALIGWLATAFALKHGRREKDRPDSGQGDLPKENSGEDEPEELDLETLPVSEEEKYLSGNEPDEDELEAENAAGEAEEEIRRKLAGEVKQAENSKDNDEFEDVNL